MKKRIFQVVLGSALAIAFTLPAGKATFGDRDWRSDCSKRLEADRARNRSRRGQARRAQPLRWTTMSHAWIVIVGGAEITMPITITVDLR